MIIDDKQDLSATERKRRHSTHSRNGNMDDKQGAEQKQKSSADETSLTIAAIVMDKDIIESQLATAHDVVEQHIPSALKHHLDLVSIPDKKDTLKYLQRIWGVSGTGGAGTDISVSELASHVRNIDPAVIDSLLELAKNSLQAPNKNTPQAISTHGGISIYHPPLECKNKQLNDKYCSDRYVVKICKPYAELKSELATSERLALLDPEHQFYIRILDSSPDISDELVGYYMIYGGLTLHAFQVSVDESESDYLTVSEYQSIVHNLMSALTMMHDVVGILHGNINDRSVYLDDVLHARVANFKHAALLSSLSKEKAEQAKHADTKAMQTVLLALSEYVMADTDEESRILKKETRELTAGI